MRRRLILLLLLACVLADNVTRHFAAVFRATNWADAQSYCRAKFTDLASIQDAAANTAAQQVAGRGRFWIGLYNTSWRWSLGNEDVSLHTSYTNWAPGEPGPRSCVAVSDSGLWSVRDCAVRYWFLCYSAATNTHVLVQVLMNRADAQNHCTTEYTDMSSIKSPEDNVQASGLLRYGPTDLLQPTTLSPGNSSTTTSSAKTSPVEAWIGLSRYLWGWSDSSRFTYSQWAWNQPSGSNCVALDATAAHWYSQLCENNLSFLCYTDKTYSDLKTVKLRLRGGPVDLNDSVALESILQQLKKKLPGGGAGGTKLSWRRRPEGDAFHREEAAASAPPCGRDQKPCECVV